MDIGLVELLLTGLTGGGVGVVLWYLIKRGGSRGAFATYENLLGNLSTPETRQLMVSAAYLALANRAQRVERSHVLLALATRPEFALLLGRHRLSLNKLAELAAAAPRYDDVDEIPTTVEEMSQTNLKEATTPLLAEAWDKARNMNKRFIDPTSLLSALIDGEGDEGRLLREAGVLAASRPEPATGHCFVYVWNDPKTTMVHVSDVMQEQFDLSEVAARIVTRTTHCCGYAALGPYPLEEAEARIEAATEVTMREGASLCVTLERPDTSAWVESPRGLLPPDIAPPMEVGEVA